MYSIKIYCIQVEKELHLLPRQRRREIVERLQEDLCIQMDEQGRGEVQFCMNLPKPEEMAAEFLENAEMKPAGLGERALALVVDLFIMFAPLVLMLALFTLIPEGGIILGVMGGLVLLSFVGMLFLYFPVLEGTWGQTVGKALLGLTVVGEDGRPISYAKAFLRRLSFWFNLFVIDGLFVLFLPRRQRALDRVAGTLVVKNGRAKPLGVSIVIVTILALLTGSLLAIGGREAPGWMQVEIPAVPTALTDPVPVVQALDLSAHGLTLAELTSQGQHIESIWQGPGGELKLLAYYGGGGRNFLQAWAEVDRVKQVSFSHQWGDRTIKRYRTGKLHKSGWHQGNWAFAVEADRNQFGNEEFKELINSISKQLENM